MSTNAPQKISLRPTQTGIKVALLGVLSYLAYLVKDSVYVGIVNTVDSSPMLTVLALFFSETALLLLVIATLAIALWAWCRDREIFWTLFSGGIGVICAFVLSKVIKIIFTEERPCQEMAVHTVSVCPPMGDWSWPSNHSVIAAAFATAVALAIRRLRWYVAGLALFIALARVAVGAHYLHDVLAGLALGLLVVTIAVAVLAPRIENLVAKRRTGREIV